MIMAIRQITRSADGQGFDTRRDEQDCDEQARMVGRDSEPMLPVKSLALDLEHQEFLNRASTGDDPPITPETALRACEAWKQIRLASDGRIPVPSACTNADGKVFFSWDCGRYHLDLDIIPGEPAEFFFCDRETNQYWCEDYRIGTPLPTEVISKLKLFI
jgi:hypothetical protein